MRSPSRLVLASALLAATMPVACADDVGEELAADTGIAADTGAGADTGVAADSGSDAVPDAGATDAGDVFGGDTSVGGDAVADAVADVQWVDRRAATVPSGNPAEPGPYVVGITTFELPPLDENDDPIGVDVWYPAVAEGEEVAQYRVLVIDVPSIAAYRDVPPDPTAPAFLVAFSHGLYGVRQQNFSMAERLASWGFVVVSADHPGTTTLDLLNNGKLEEALLARPQTVRDAVDAVYAGVVPGLVVRDGGYAMVGHSLGALTSMFVVGAQIDPDRYRAACSADPRPNECGMIGSIEATAEVIAERAWADERIITSVIQNPAGGFAFVPESLRNIPTPLVMGGELDGLGGGTLAMFDLFADDAALVVYDDCGHNGPTDICNIDLASSFSRDCDGPAGGFAEPEFVRELSVRHVVAWLGVHLGEQPEFAEYLGEGSGFVWTVQ